MLSVNSMSIGEFGDRFLNYKAHVRLVNNHTGQCEFAGMFMDIPLRYAKFTLVVRCEVDNEKNVLCLYFTAEKGIFFHRENKYINNPAIVEIPD